MFWFSIVRASLVEVEQSAAEDEAWESLTSLALATMKALIQ